MRILSLLTMLVLAVGIAFQTSAAPQLFPDSEPNKAEKCTLSVPKISGACRRGPPTVTATAPSRTKALQEARLKCGDKVIDQYFSCPGNNQPSDELALVCVNLDCTNEG